MIKYLIKKLSQFLNEYLDETPENDKVFSSKELKKFKKRLKKGYYLSEEELNKVLLTEKIGNMKQKRLAKEIVKFYMVFDFDKEIL